MAREVQDMGFKEYPHLSRYATVRVFRDREGQLFHGSVMWTRDDLPFTLYEVKQGDTIEKIANEQFGNPTYSWIIADANRIVDPFLPLEIGRQLKIISLNSLEFAKRF
jgi:hypothetical protein